jgi:type VI secretion system secreted protein VgrG
MVKLWLAGVEESLTVRELSVKEGVSTLFEVVVRARSPNPDLELESLLGLSAAVTAGSPILAGAAPRTWRGVCNAAEQLRIEPTGLSMYELRIAPELWLLTQRTSHRVFQHRSVPEIVAAILDTWGIEAVWRIDRGAYERHEYRVQYGETDFAFVSRLLEEAGIAYTFDERDGAAVVTFSDALERSEPRRAGPLSFEDSPTVGSQREHVTAVRLAHALRPGAVLLQDFDFRRRLDVPLATSATVESAHEARLEQHLYVRGAFFSEGTPADPPPRADDLNASRAVETVGKRYAQRTLEAVRSGKRVVRFRTNAIDLVPGAVFSIAGHGHSGLESGAGLLVTELRTSAEHDGITYVDGEAVFTDVPYRPARRTQKPVVQGVESAVVVGPEREEIHTDELGRVRVQFPWDRYGELDEKSSCWIRVSQAWAGAGHGFVALPRVGQEVVVGFFGGDPDQPIVVGRVFNVTSPPPYRLPLDKTKTVWRSASTAGSDGWNEISFDDASGAEVLFVQAQRNLETIVKEDESTSVGGDRELAVAGSDEIDIRGDQALFVGGGQSIQVGGDRALHVTGAVRTSASRGYSVTVEGPRAPIDEGEAAEDDSAAVEPEIAEPEDPPRKPTGIDVTDGKITLTTGEATLTLEGPNLTLEAAASLLLSAASNITITGRANIFVTSGANVLVHSEDGDLILEGGPAVHINSKPTLSDPDELPESPEGVDLDELVEGAEELMLHDPSEPDALGDALGKGGAWDPEQWGPAHRRFGFFAAGVLAAEAGVPFGVLARQLGKRARAEGRRGAGDPANGVFGGEAPYGLSPEEYALVRGGAAHHAREYA